jgi:phosphoglycerate-specific signal transduction histidine kinase
MVKHSQDTRMNNKKQKTYKEKIADRTFNDQIEDAWHLLEKKRKLKRKKLFIKIDDIVNNEISNNRMT